jgi:hypothetical protein
MLSWLLVNADTISTADDLFLAPLPPLPPPPLGSSQPSTMVTASTTSTGVSGGGMTSRLLGGFQPQPQPQPNYYEVRLMWIYTRTDVH